MWQVPAQVSAAWEGGADNHLIIPLSGPGLNCPPREHSGGLEKIARKYRKTDTATSKLSSIEAAQSFSLIFPHLLMRILVNLVREWVEI